MRLIQALSMWLISLYLTDINILLCERVRNKSNRKSFD